MVRFRALFVGVAPVLVGFDPVMCALWAYVGFSFFLFFRRDADCPENSSKYRKSEENPWILSNLHAKQSINLRCGFI